ncbi:MAG: hypothetical protein V3V72_01715 [Ignavibacteriaceae bacterium]|jgi:hypothetical protein
MEFKLYRFNKPLKRFLSFFLITLTCGMIIGLVYLNQTTSLSANGTINRISGSQEDAGFDIPDYYPKPISELLVTTHNHIIGFALIFFVIGGLFYFNTMVNGFWKNFIMIEPLISVLVTFGSIWGLRFISIDFIHIAIVSSTLIYTSYFVMVFIILYELNFKKSPSN